MSDTPYKPLAVGDWIEDNDPRSKHLGPWYRVTSIGPNYAVAHYQQTKRSVKVRLDRIYLDGKPRKSGWSRVAVSNQA